MMPIDDWHTFLKQWSEEWLSTDEPFPRNVRRQRWLGSKPAIQEQIEALEKKLGVVLPPSYKAFLRTTNGWRRTSPFIQAIRPARRVNWLATAEPELIESWSEADLDPSEMPDMQLPDEKYFTYEPQVSEAFRLHELPHTLRIADSIPGDTAIYLLNPEAVTEDGEWEAWFHAHWIPGTVRHPSFAHLMLDEYYSFRRLELGDKSQRQLTGPYQGPAAPDRPRSKAQTLPGGRRVKAPPTLDQLVRQLSSSNADHRKAAAKRLFRKAGTHRPERARPDLIEPLTATLHGPYEPRVRSAAACALGTYGNETAVDVLLERLEATPDIADSILSALNQLTTHYLAPSLAPALIRAAEQGRFEHLTRPDYLVSIFEDLSDARALPVVRRYLIEGSSTVHWLRSKAAGAMASLGRAGVDALIELLEHPDPKVRAAAASGLGGAKDPHVTERLRRLLEDPDNDVRQKARNALILHSIRDE